MIHPSSSHANQMINNLRRLVTCVAWHSVVDIALCLKIIIHIMNSQFSYMIKIYQADTSLDMMAHGWHNLTAHVHFLDVINRL